MTDNLKLWNAVSRVPQEHLKPFDRGTFKGTAIKPAWAYKTMTEHAGPCGEGWSIDQPQFTMVDGVKGEKLVYCVVTVTHKGGSVVGVGGDKVIKYTAPNERYNRPERWDNDDEAFKKAYTDALTNALVKLGVGADIHMGLWDGNKYADETPANSDTAPPKPTPQTTVGTDAKLLTAEEARKLYAQLVAEMRELKSDAGIAKWKADSKSRIDQLGSWSAHIDNAINDHITFLLNGKAA
jgi:hypothetical protein